MEINPSCADDFDAQALPVGTAMRNILSAVQPVAETRRVLLRHALGRVLATPVCSEIAVPGHTNSAMDGYALHADDLPQHGTAELKAIGASFAGRPFGGRVNAGECVRIMTGAVMPEGSDTVVIQEQAQALDGSVKIGTGHKPGQNVRRAGEDIAPGATVLQRGTRLMPAQIGLLASLGIAQVEVFRELEVFIFSTGDELRPVGTPLKTGELYDSNRYTLHGMLSRLGAKVNDLGVVGDDPDALRQALEYTAHNGDAVITSGGVSVGEADYTRQAMETLGRVNFWKVAMKPGRPLAFGRIGDAVYFGLPGNPVSVMATFYIFVQPALLRMAGATEIEAARLRVHCRSELRKRPGRVEYQRGILEINGDGNCEVRSTGPQGSGILSSMTQANCMIVLPAESRGTQSGDTVTVIPFAGLV